MRIYAVSPTAFKQQYLDIQLADRECPWPNQATLLISFFLNAIDLDAAHIEDLGDGYLDVARVRETLQELVDCGVLVRVDGEASAADNGLDEARRRRLTMIGMLGGIARAIYDLAEDASAFVEPPAGIEARIGELYQEVLKLRAQLREQRPSYLSDQLTRLGIGPDAKQLKLHFGVPGLRRLPGWINIEPAPGELAMSLTWDLPFADGSVQYIFSAHTLEHLYYKSDALHFLKEAYRVLEPDGLLRVVVPDIGMMAEAVAAHDAEFATARSRMKHYDFASMYRTPLEHMLRYAGAGTRPGEFFLHKYGYDRDTLANLLREAGFAEVTSSSFMKSAHAELQIDDQCSAAHHGYRERSFSLFMEAKR